MDNISKLVGRTPVKIESNDDTITIVFSDGAVAKFHHDQDCCECVYIADVNGDWSSLVGEPLLVAEVRVDDNPDTDAESATWTFYTFRGVGGSVDVRWVGESNGYYSESVDLDFIEPATSMTRAEALEQVRELRAHYEQMIPDHKGYPDEQEGFRRDVAALDVAIAALTPKTAPAKVTQADHDWATMNIECIQAGKEGQQNGEVDHAICFVVACEQRDALYAENVRLRAALSVLRGDEQ